jgi:4-amino-4-deoxy-L-arabinose transferase-like glycosyltransferase
MIQKFFNRSIWGIVIILAIGFFLRLWQFPNPPPGLYLDEASSGYDAFALLQTGMDRWGIRYPVYFIHWGSGQNALYTYLSMPLVAILGLSRFSIRLLNALFGILTLPLLYATIKPTLGKSAAMMATLLLALMPWHAMFSRWALESQLLPFFLLLGTFTVQRALAREKQNVWHWFALVPWAISLYAYAIAYLLVPLLLGLIIIFYRETILRNWKIWLVNLIILGLFAAPLVLFFIKNNFVCADLPFESLLPFGIPLMPYSRLAQVTSPVLGRLEKNFWFAINGFQDGNITQALPDLSPTFVVLVPLALVGTFYAMRRYRESKQINLFALWFIASALLLLPWDLSVARVNSLFIPMLVVGVAGLGELARRLQNQARAILFGGVALLIALQATVFIGAYFGEYSSRPDSQLAYFQGFDRAILRGVAIAAPTEPILVTDAIQWPYLLVLFYTQYAPADFQNQVNARTDLGEITVLNFGRFNFGADNLSDPSAPFTFVLAKWDDDPCAQPALAFETRLWKVGTCNHAP